MRGIDVSYHQGTIDWGKVKNAGIDFAMIRAGYGKSSIDKKFIENICGADTAGVKVGIYWFIYATNKKEAIENADKCIQTIDLYKDIIKMGVAADYEYDSDKYSQKNGVTQTKESRSAIVKAFLSRLKESGYEVLNYANPDYLKSKFDGLEGYPTWLAWYTSNESRAKAYSPIMWQYSSSGKVDGIEGNVDMNVYYGDIQDTEYSEREDGGKMMPVLCYSKSKNGNEKLSENFKASEFACKDGSDVVFISPELVKVLQKIRDHFERPVIINSAYRTPTYNKKVGGATYSQHQYGTAADIKINGVSPRDIASYAETLMPSSGGIGVYSGFTHIDVRDTRSRWNG